MRPRRYGDSGQAFPIYITVVGGLLFLAFAYFAVGQAAVNRNSAQTAADSAALAAAIDARRQLTDQWLLDVLDPTKWQDVFEGNAPVSGSCLRADQLLSQNDATALACNAVGPLRYEVGARTNKPVGDSVVPGTENMKAQARATAVIEPLCTFVAPAPSPTPSPDPSASPSPGDDGPLPELTCRGRGVWDLDPRHLTDLPKPEDLFDVHLAD
ncbi:MULTISPECIES: pilus assembly protein TadG-related protein [unclassified Streptomyces]|uniref:pilus assembly protein TadG-related protein n=1 Tax=unclassified Streptomyces TaxID=2593676 RepID=UPI0033283824